MRVVQLLTTLRYGDGVGNDALALDGLLKKNGYDTMIYAENIDARIAPETARYFDKMPRLGRNDVILYHLSTGTQLNYKLPGLRGRKIIIYHNNTPPQWFAPYDRKAENLAVHGIKGIEYLAGTAQYCLADSAFNKEDLLQKGYRCRIDVLPILIPFDDYRKTPDAGILKKYRGGGYTNIVFTGRIAPNKRQEDVIEAFFYYKKYYNPKSRLFLVGSYKGMERYYGRLRDYVERLGVKDVHFTGHISFSAILAYYALADVFLCMSGHEGFCIPLLEAMSFDIPVVACCETAVTETLGGSGIGMKERNTLLAAGLMDRVVTDREFRERVLETQRERLADFDNQKTGEKFLSYLENFIRQNKRGYR